MSITDTKQVDQKLKRNHSDPCIDFIKVPVGDVFDPLAGPAPSPAAFQFTTPAGVTALESIAVQTDLSACHLKNLTGSGRVTSWAFAKFLTGKRISAYDVYEGKECAEENMVSEPPGCSLQALPVTLSERFVYLDRGPVPIMQNPRLTKIMARRKKMVKESCETKLSEVKVEWLADLSKGPLVQTTMASQITSSPNQLSDITHEQEMGSLGLGESAQTGPNAKKPTADVIDGHLLSSCWKLPQDQHSILAEPTLDGAVAGVGADSLHTCNPIGASFKTGPCGAFDLPVWTALPNDIYEECVTEHTKKHKVYLEEQHMASLSEIPEEDRLVDLQQSFFLPIMRGVCKYCGEKLKHLELTDLFRYKLLNKDESFAFDSEHFCCGEFQKELENLLFSHGVSNTVRDIRRPQLGVSPKRTGTTGSFHVVHDGQTGKRVEGAAEAQLETIARLLEGETDNRSSSDEETDEEDTIDEGNSNARNKTEANNMKGKFRDRLRSRSEISMKDKSTVAVRSVTAGSGIGSSLGRRTKDKSTGLVGSGVKIVQSSGSVIAKAKSSASNSRRHSNSLNSRPDEIDSRYHGNSICWSLSSKICAQTGWTLLPPQPVQSNGYLSENLLDENFLDQQLFYSTTAPGLIHAGPGVDQGANSAAGDALAHHWAVFPARFVHWRDDILVSPYLKPPSATDFYPYSDGSTACVTAEYAPGLSIVVVLPKLIGKRRNMKRPICPIAAIFDTASWGALINPDWNPSVLMTRKELKLNTGSAKTGKEEKRLSWKTLGGNICNPKWKTKHQLNDEAQLDIRGPDQIILALKNDKMRMQINCGFGHSKAAGVFNYSSPSEDGAKSFLKKFESRKQEMKKCIWVLNGLLDEAEPYANALLSSTGANRPTKRKNQHRRILKTQ